MALPEIKFKSDNVTQVQAFLGINKGLHILESEFEDERNITNDYYPVLANRKKRGVLQKFNDPNGVIGGQYLAYVDGTDLYFNGTKINLGSYTLTNSEKQLIRMGAYLCVFPDGIIYNTYDGEVSSIENKTTSTTTVVAYPCKLDGTIFDSSNTYIGNKDPNKVITTSEDSEETEETIVVNYDYWIDTSGKEAVLKMWADTYSMWTTTATTYVKFTSPGIGKGFKKYDGVYFDGVTFKGYNDYEFNKKTHIIYDCSDNYLVVAGFVASSNPPSQSTPITFERKLPEMDYVFELDNRIWGCSSENHEIYACKQGDPTNFNSYAGLDSDSYAATVGSQGEFTGAIAYAGYGFFFKEDGFHKLYGKKPSNFEMIYKPGRGVQKGCSKSLAIVNEVLFYKSRDAVVAYDGSIDVISENLGNIPYYDAVGVGYRNKYYLSMRDNNYKYLMYVYDVTKRTWCIEDEFKAKYMVYANNGTYIIDDKNQMYLINNEKMYKKYFPMQDDLGDTYHYPNNALYPGEIIEGEMEDNFEWSLTTGDLGLDNPYNKYLKRINLRFELENSTKLRIEIEYDSSGVFEYVTEYFASKRRSYEVPISVKRADHVRLRLSGFGDVKIYSIAKAVEGGSGETNGVI